MNFELTRQDEISPQETMRYRDLLLQVQRFLKYGTKGTAAGVVQRQAKEFDLRLSALVESYESRKVSRLREKLKRLYEGGQ